MHGIPGSGCAQTFYTVDGSDPKISGTVQTFTTSIPLSADTTLTFYSVDGDGNAGDTVTETYAFDFDAPGVSIVSPAQGSVQRTPVVSGTASDGGLGIDKVEVLIQEQGGILSLNEDPLQGHVLRAQERDLRGGAVIVGIVATQGREQMRIGFGGVHLVISLLWISIAGAGVIRLMAPRPGR